MSAAGPYTQWATGQGFERFYGFLAADADNFNPILLRDTAPVMKADNADYHLSADLADKAIAMIEDRSARSPARPFFMYWATGAAHAPHHAPQEWRDRYRGKFDMGWDAARASILRAQIAKGMLPKNTMLAPTPPDMPVWDRLNANQKRLFARQMEAFAAALSHADAQFGRILDTLEARGELDNTIVVITSDNGASAEGGTEGLYNEAEVTSRKAPGVEGNMPFFDKWGGPQTYPHYAYGWAVAGNTPFRQYKQTTYQGGSRVPLIIAWPKGIKARGELRSQFAHASDMAPTLLEAADAPITETINNSRQLPMEGQSIASTFADASAPGHGRKQYIELYGNRALYDGKWVLVASHRVKTWDFNSAKTFNEPWELYDLEKDPGQTTDLASQHPDRVTDMGKEFETQAQRYNVYPLHNLSDTAAESAQRGRTDFERRNGLWAYPGPVGNIPASLAPPINMLGFNMQAEIEVTDGKATGPIFAYGGQLGGMGLYLDQAKPVFILTSLSGKSVSVTADMRLQPGKHVIELILTKGTPAADGTPEQVITIKANGQTVASAKLAVAIPAYFGISEVFGVGNDEGSPVLAGYRAGLPYPGKIGPVRFQFDSTNKLASPIHQADH